MFSKIPQPFEKLNHFSEHVFYFFLHILDNRSPTVHFFALVSSRFPDKQGLEDEDLWERKETRELSYVNNVISRKYKGGFFPCSQSRFSTEAGRAPRQFALGTDSG